jgi:hypothetical protein
MSPNDDGLDYLKKLAQTVVEKERKAAADKSLADPPSQRQFGPTGPIPPTRTSSAMVPKMPMPTPTPTAQPAVQPVAATKPSGTHWKRDVQVTGPGGAYLPGTILYFEDQTVAIYRGEMKDKDYEMVYELAATGRLKPQGIPLASYDVRPLGRIAPAYLEKLMTGLKWDRDLLIFHLLEYEDCMLIPQIVAQSNDTPAPQSSTSVAKLSLSPDASGSSAPPANPFVRGRKLTIVFGTQTWNAVFWGSDELGTVVAHKTHEHWALMHLDLKRFKQGMVIGDMASGAEVAAIESDLVRVGGG